MSLLRFLIFYDLFLLCVFSYIIEVILEDKKMNKKKGFNVFEKKYDICKLKEILRKNPTRSTLRLKSFIKYAINQINFLYKLQYWFFIIWNWINWPSFSPPPSFSFLSYLMIFKIYKVMLYLHFPLSQSFSSLFPSFVTLHHLCFPNFKAFLKILFFFF